MSAQKISPFAATLLAAALMVVITVVLPFYFKTWFVEETGNIRLLPAVGPLLAVAMLLRWSPARKIALFFFAVGLVFSLLGLARAEAPFQAGYAFLVALHVFLLWTLWRDGVKQYVETGKPLIARS